MFEHLDDRSPAAPADAAREAVLRRANLIRRRRRVGVLGAVVLVLAAVSTGLLIRGPSTARLASTETAYQFNSVKGPLPVGTPVPTTALVNVTFVDEQFGFALAAHQDQVVLAASSDGGATWTVRDGKLPLRDGEGDGYPGELEFVGATGYLWGGTPNADGADPVWISHDDGASWDQAPIGPVIYDVSAIESNVWALTGTCDVAPDGGPPPASCPLVMEESLDGGASWHATRLSGLTDVSGSALLGERVELARITTRRAYVLTVGDSTGLSGAAPVIALVFTDNSGSSWTTRPVPCSGAFALGAEVAASSTDDLWLLCGSQATGGEQSKELYRSEDGGLTWTLTASATGLGTPPPTPSRPNTLSLGGYISPYSIGHKNLAVASATTAWLYPFRSDMYKTVSDGRAWAAVPGLDTAGFGSGGPGNVTFISATRGWVCEYGVGLWHTSDGVHWTPLGV
ncbi:MAG TPA: sialidase family protein [Acidimicrobiales bacterium]|jgi:hypothetical protein